MPLINELYKYRYLIWELIMRDIKKKYRRSILGVFWSLLNPLFVMLITAMIFSHLFRFDIENYPLYLLCGQIIFTFYNESTRFAMLSIIENGILLKKVYILKYLFPASRVFSSCVNLLFTLPALFFIMIFTGAKFSLITFTFIIPIFFMLIFCLGVGLILSTLAVYFRDMVHLYGVFLSLLSYATPIFYPDSIVPEEYSIILKINPLYFFLKAFRQPVCEGIMPEADLMMTCIAISIVTLFIGWRLFKKYQNNFVLYI
ncbi:MAG: ABC transporter permease [Selenomonadaceae bacterium]|nr:ABC transporter permease [Selenomonadaceae bacterium]MBR1858582.1 ABC transporter permease [Selenomonadaceae bacterium]